MDDIATRLLQVRKDQSLSQADFAQKLNLSQNFVWLTEKGQRLPGDRTISDICRVFGVNEVWLRTGAGEMYTPRTREEEVAELVGQALTGTSDFKLAVIKMICSRSDKELEALEAALRSICDSL